MSADRSTENEPKQAQDSQARGPEPNLAHPAEHHRTQAERDDEITALQQHARRQHPGIECPPERPPAPPRKGLLFVGLALLVLLGAGGLTMLDRLSRDCVLARETEQSAVPS